MTSLSLILTAPRSLRLAAGVLCVWLAAIPHAISAPETAYALVQKGNAAYNAGRWDEALGHYNEASVESPESAELYFNQGTVHYQKGDYEAADKAFSSAALRGKELTFEAKARYNQGNCAFREAERQRDSDLKKAIEACRTAIGHYQDAFQLNPAMKTAAENIEVVRLYVKMLLDEQQKKEEEQQQQDDLGKKLKELLERQIAAITETKKTDGAKPVAPVPPLATVSEPVVEVDPFAATEPNLTQSADDAGIPAPDDAATPVPNPAPDVAATAAWEASIDTLGSDQETLRTDTSGVLEEMRQLEVQMQQPVPAQPGQAQAPAPTGIDPAQANEMAEKLGTAIGHVDQSITAQDEAVATLGQRDLRTAQSYQQKSAEQILAALQALSDPEQQDQDQEKKDQEQNKDDQEQQDENGDKQDGEDGEQKDQKGEKGEEDKEDKEDKQGDENKDQEKKEGDQEGKGQSKSEQGDEDSEKKEQQSALKPLKDSPEDILNEEKENQKRRVPVRTGGVRPVDRDW